MEASILDLRKNMKKVMSALERNERVTLTRRHRKMAVIIPEGEKQEKKTVSIIRWMTVFPQHMTNFSISADKC